MPKVSQAKSAVKSKGYVAEGTGSGRSVDHQYFYFYYDGKKTDINTHFSHHTAGSDLQRNELSGMKTQMKFRTSKQLEEFISCTMTAAQYEQMLMEDGHLNDNEPEAPPSTPAKNTKGAKKAKTK